MNTLNCGSLHRRPGDSITEQLLRSISEATEMAAKLEIERETFCEIGCYLYRTSVAIMEFRVGDDVACVLRSLSCAIQEIKEVVRGVLESSRSDSSAEIENAISEIGKLVNRMGNSVSLLPIAELPHSYELAIRSLAREMTKAELIVKQKPQNNAKPEKAGPREERECFKDPMEKSVSCMYEYVEPVYESFCCPLSKEIMNEPVTIESGITFEKEAIGRFFEENRNVDEICCPVSGQKLSSTDMRANAAIKNTIDEWRRRNDAARIKISRTAMSLASSPSMALDGVAEVRDICRRKANKEEVRNSGILQPLANLLEYRDRNVICSALGLLGDLTEDDEGKEEIAEVLEICKVVKMISSTYEPIKHAALALLLHLSKSETLSERIGAVAGGILILIRLKNNHVADDVSAKKAEEILRNLGKSTENVRIMAENGFLEPLMNRLAQGSEETQTEMANCLGEIAVNQDVGITGSMEKICPALLSMVQRGNNDVRKSAYKALRRLSTCHKIAPILQKGGVLHAMVGHLLVKRARDETTNSKTEAAAILANLLEAGIEFHSLNENNLRHKISMEYFLHTIVQMLKGRTPEELKLSLLKVILVLMNKNPSSVATVASLLKEAEACSLLDELISSADADLVVSAIKLMSVVAPHMGHIIVDTVCRSNYQLDRMIFGQSEGSKITEKQVASARLLAGLPHQNLKLNLLLLRRGTVPAILETIREMQKAGTRISKQAMLYLEGIVGILARFTATLHDPQVMHIAKTHNLTSFFTEQLAKASSDEVQRQSASALAQLSSESIVLSQSSQGRKREGAKLFSPPRILLASSSRRMKSFICPVHKGICSSKETFCLIEAKSVGVLVECLGHGNPEVVEAALMTVCTLLDSRVDVDQSISILEEANAMQQVLNVAKRHDEDCLRRQSFWVIEKLLVKGGTKKASEMSEDRVLLSKLAAAFLYGAGNSKQMAERILILLNKIPDFQNF